VTVEDVLADSLEDRLVRETEDAELSDEETEQEETDDDVGECLADVVVEMW
jgi:hypothetical protein